MNPAPVRRHNFTESERNDTILKEQADVAQLVEQLIRNQQVIGSSPIVGSIPASQFPPTIEFRFADNAAFPAPKRAIPRRVGLVRLAAPCAMAGPRGDCESSQSTTGSDGHVSPTSRMHQHV
jgi:hypothetical protein